MCVIIYNLWRILIKASYLPLLFSVIFSSIKPVAEKHAMLFAHGLADTHLQADNWKSSEKDNDKPCIFNGSITCKDFLDATTHFWRVNFPWTSLGQDNEMAVILETYEEIKAANPEQRFIFGGLSRGASTMLNFLATHKPEKVDAVVLEAPFSSMRDVAQNIVESCFLKNIPYLKEISPQLVGLIFWQYSDASIHPIDVVQKIDQNIPIIIISKEDDHLVPTKITRLIVEKLRSHGHKKVHHLIMNEGQHGKYILGNEGKRMQNVVQAFYKYYDLPHNKEQATKGAFAFAQTFHA